MRQFWVILKGEKQDLKVLKKARTPKLWHIKPELERMEKSPSRERHWGNVLGLNFYIEGCEEKVIFKKVSHGNSWVQFSHSFVSNSATMYIDCSMPGFPVHHQLWELTQTQVHWIGNDIQPSQSSVVPFSSCPQSLPASGSFQVSQLFVSGGQSIGVSALASVLPKNTRTDLL